MNSRFHRSAQYLFIVACLFTIVSCIFPFTEAHIVKGTSDRTEMTRIFTTVGFCWIILAAVIGIIIVLIHYKRALVLTIGIIIFGGSLMLLSYGVQQKKEYMAEKVTFNIMSELMVRPVEKEPVVEFKYCTGYYLTPAFGISALATSIICFITVKDEEE